MNQDIPLRQRFFALALLGTLPALGAVIPILDLMVGDGKPAVESRHIPGTHGFPHNHLICIQQQANQWASSEFDPSPPLPGASFLPVTPGPVLRLSATPITLPRPRAPPLT